MYWSCPHLGPEEPRSGDKGRVKFLMVLRDVSMLLPALCGIPWQGPTASKRTLRLPERRKAQETTTSDVEVYENKALLASPIGISGCSRQRWNTSLRSANAERSEKVSSREAALGSALHSAVTSPPGTLASDSQDLRISTSAKAEAGPRLGALRRASGFPAAASASPLCGPQSCLFFHVANSFFSATTF